MAELDQIVDMPWEGEPGARPLTDQDVKFLEETLGWTVTDRSDWLRRGTNWITMRPCGPDALGVGAFLTKHGEGWAVRKFKLPVSDLPQYLAGL